MVAAEIVGKANPGYRKKMREQKKGRGLSLRGRRGKRDSLAGGLRGRIVVRFLAHLAGESYFQGTFIAYSSSASNGVLFYFVFTDSQMMSVDWE